ncbi:pas domain s-box protein [Stylonychia lemnae]|uniref:histidine kinase n=1 Tax=Stylonychia lemnae TaxID=5949 RepID=A0A078B3T0_STYLE|nr:pas domain s-box protein [Stylonychia lemnae]|eukprot:CDW88876.1 pas domain s-box protein [Stylonychia lemnae]
MVSTIAVFSMEMARKILQIPRIAYCPNIPNNYSEFIANFFSIINISSISLIVTSCGIILFYGLYIHYADFFTIASILTVTCLLIYACYFYEKRLKLLFIQLHHIKKMNEDLKKLLDKLPEGILLFNPETNSVSLANEEYRRIFNIVNHDSAQTNDQQQYFKDCIENQLLKKYKFQKDQNPLITGEQNQLNQNCVGILEALSSDLDKDECYQVAHQILDENFLSNHSGNLATQGEIVSLSQCQILFQNVSHCMIMVKNLTPVIKYEKLKIENHFYEMLTATVSHDMRTPLNIMSGLLGTLDNYIHDDQGKRFLNIIRNSSKFMCFLVNDLLDFFQIKNGKFKKNLQWCWSQ